MDSRRICALAVLAVAFAFTPNSASAFRLPDPCAQTRSNFSQQIRELKLRQAQELAQCEAGSGRSSGLCNEMKERQKEEMRQLLERQRLSLNGCDGRFFAFDSEDNRHYFHNSNYQNNYYPEYPRRPHYHDHDGDGDHHHHHHDHDGDGGHHHHHHDAVASYGNQGSHAGSTQFHRDSNSHSATVSAVAVHQQWVHNQHVANSVVAEEATRLRAVAAADTADRRAIAVAEIVVAAATVVAEDTAAPAADIVAAEAATVGEAALPAATAAVADHILLVPKVGDAPSRNSWSANFPVPFAISYTALQSAERIHSNQNATSA